MTREEIQKAAEEYAKGSPNATLRHKAFIDGAEYADKHPNWHSVTENPKAQGIYLVKVEVACVNLTPSCEVTKYELAPYAEYQGVMKWHTLGFSYPNSRITHWMEIPAVELNIEHPAKKQTVIDAWAARDRNTDLYVYDEKPHEFRNEWLPNKTGGTFLKVDCTLFQEVTFENSPMKVKVTIELEDE